MNSPTLPSRPSPDYYPRALALWPRLDHPRQRSVRHDPVRMAALISRRTNLSTEAILDLLGAPDGTDGIPAGRR